MDLAFFVVDATTGEPREAPRLVPMTYYGEELYDPTPDLRFDFARNWRLVEALVTHPTIGVQWIFVRKGLRRRLLRHARGIGVDPGIIARAEAVLHQPSDADRHADHFHVRVFCAPDDLAEGCVDPEPYRAWVPSDLGAASARSAAMSYGVRDPAKPVRTAVAEHVLATEAFLAAPALAEMAIRDPSSELRGRAASELLAWQGRFSRDTTWRRVAVEEAVVDALAAFVRAPGAGLAADDARFTVPSRDLPLPYEGPIGRWIIGEEQPRRGVEILRAYKLLAKMASPSAVAFVSSALASERVIELGQGQDVLEARLATKVAVHLMDLRLVPALVRALLHRAPKVRVAADVALRRLSNHVLRGVRWGRGVAPDALTRHAAAWAAWWETRQERPRAELLLEGFRRRGVRLVGLDDEANVRRLVPLTQRKDEIGYNADRLLVRITGRHTPLGLPAEARHRRWRRWYP